MNQTFTFASLPTSLSALQALPEAKLDTPFMTCALALAVLCNYGASVPETVQMLNFLKGPAPLSPFEQQFLRDRFSDGKTYKPFSFFAGATPQNGYTPTAPYTITVSDNPYSYTSDGLWATLYVKSSGADSPRPMKFRKKPSTNQWFLNDIQCLSDIRIPTASDPWA